MQNTEPTSAITSPAAAALRINKRRQNGRAALPKTTEAHFLDGDKAAMGALHGTRGRGKFMLLDTRDWHDIKTTIGDVWLLNSSGNGHEYVRRSAHAIGANARQPGARPTATLARIIMDAKRGEVVLYRDGNPLNLRRANLEVVTKSEATRRRAANGAA
jgi:hypothetical protein